MLKRSEKILAIACLLLMAPVLPTAGQERDSAARGVYFAKPRVQTAPLPSYQEHKDRLPAPVLDDNPDYIELYWRAWELAFAHLQKPSSESPLIANYIDAFPSPNIHQMDTLFMLMFMRYAHPIFPAIESLDNFYCRQHDSGFICREIRKADGSDVYDQGAHNTINPPLFSWAEVEWYHMTDDAFRFEQVIPVLAQYAAWIEMNRVKPGAVHGLFWNTALGSGM
ncbi:hypothetical protein JXO59_05560, partial [candidate division KSB1 bacterium]|nr:hypothetical protein [candidate division KSB1 bacterium]